ncbi:MAG: hypothetical protein DWQ30_08670 [Acidobacteria bacterium]|nr:MAG: hypothetical protein DWQ30_08670 [Acidobacteriota bacterium]
MATAAWLCAAALLHLSAPRPASAQAAGSSSPHDSLGGFTMPTRFPFAVELDHHGEPADGRYDVRLRLYDRSEGGAALATVEQPEVLVRDGALEAFVDFGTDVFSLRGAFIEVSIREAATNAPFTELQPRRRLGGRGAACTVAQDVQINGTLTVDAPAGTSDVTVACCNPNGDPLEDGGQIRLFSFASDLRLDASGLAAQGFGAPLSLRINPAGGNVGIGPDAPEAPLHVSSGSVRVGPASGVDMRLAPTSISTDATALRLNPHGGNVVIVGGPLDLGITRVVASGTATQFEAHCPTGKQIISGGCSSGGDVSLLFSNRADADSWTCAFDDEALASSHQAFALCGHLAWD